MDAKLVVVGGDAKPAEFRLRPPLIIGRGREATLTLPHPLVSRKHCEIVEQDGQLVVRDLNSLNGTFINEQRVSESALPPGALLTLGTVTFRAVYASDVTTEPTSDSAAEILPAADFGGQDSSLADTDPIPELQDLVRKPEGEAGRTSATADTEPVP